MGEKRGEYWEGDMVFDDAQKISRLNAPGFNRLVTTWKARKEKDTKSKATEVNWPKTLRSLS